MAHDATRNRLYVADLENRVVRQIDLGTGAVTTLAGASGQAGDRNGTGGQARFGTPRALIVVDGLLYVSDSVFHKVKRIDPDTGIVDTIAGTGVPGAQDGVAASATFYSPANLATDGSSLFVSDFDNYVIRKIDLGSSMVSTVAGTPGLFGSADGAGSMARFYGVVGLAHDAGLLWVSDGWNHTIRRIEVATGVVTTFAGVAGMAGTTDGVGSAARFNEPGAIVADGLGSLYIADRQNHTVRKLSIGSGEVTRIAGNPAVRGWRDGENIDVLFSVPTGLAWVAGTLYVADTDNQVVRRLDPVSRQVGTRFGIAPSYGSNDGTGGQARFDGPVGLASDGQGHFFTADATAGLVRQINVADGATITLAGAAGMMGGQDGVGASARFAVPGPPAYAEGRLFVPDAVGQTIREVRLDGTVTTLAGSHGASGSADGMGPVARFWTPGAVVGDGAGKLYVADSGNHTVRMITIADARVTTFAGEPGVEGLSDGVGGAARFSRPSGLALEGDALYVADIGNHAVRKITLPGGAVITLAGGSSGSTDGTGAAASFGSPISLALDGKGSLYVADLHQGNIRKIVIASRAVTTVAGSAGLRQVRLGPLPGGLNSPAGLALTPDGDLAVTEYGENAILLLRGL